MSTIRFDFNLPLLTNRYYAKDCLSPPHFYVFFGIIHFVFIYLYVLYSIAFNRGLPKLARLGLDVADYNKGFLVFLLYTICWFLGYCLLNYKYKYKVRYPRVLLKGKRLSLELLCLVFISLAFLFLSLLINHPARNYISGRSSYTEGLYGKGFFLVIVLLVTSFVVLSAHVFSFKLSKKELFRKSKGYSLGIALMVVLSNTFLLSYLFIYLDGKARAIFPIVVVLFLWHYKVRKIRAFWLFIFGSLIVAAAIFIDIYILGASLKTSNLIDVIWGLESGRTFDGLYNLSMLVKHASEPSFKFFLGATFLTDILDDLGLSFGITSRAYLMQNVYNYPPDVSFGFPITKPGEFFLNFGWLGVSVGGFLLGYYSRMTYRILIENSVLSDVSVPVYIFIIMGFGMANPTGYFFQSIVINVLYVCFLILFWMLMQGGTRISLKR